MSAATKTRAQDVKQPPAAAAPSPKASKLDQLNALEELLEQAKVICVLLAHNYGGDGSFPEPCKAPGIEWLPSMVASLLRSADTLANDIDTAFDAEESLAIACALAAHLNGLAGEELPDGSNGFRLGDLTVATSYWTVEQLIIKAEKAWQGDAQ